MPINPEDRSFVFIITYGRSGSTLLQSILQSIDGYCIRGENNNVLLPMFRAFVKLRFAKKRHGNENNKPWHGIENVNPKRFAKKMANLFIEEVLQPDPDARVIGFKEIRYNEMPVDELYTFLNFMQENFPGVKFVFNTRNWENVSKSGWWANRKIEKVEEIIKANDALYHEFSANNPEIGHVVSYDDYTKDPESLRSLFEFLGEDFDIDKINDILSVKLTH